MLGIANEGKNAVYYSNHYFKAQSLSDDVVFLAPSMDDYGLISGTELEPSQTVSFSLPLPERLTRVSFNYVGAGSGELRSLNAQFERDSDSAVDCYDLVISN